MNEKILNTLESIAHSSQATSSEIANLRAAVDELRSAQNSLVLAVERSVTAQAMPASLQTRVEDLARTSEELRRQNDAMRAQAEAFAAQQARKTIPPQVMTLLAKSGVGADSIGANGRVDSRVLDRALEGLPVEQRIAVKSQLARAGVLD